MAPKRRSSKKMPAAKRARSLIDLQTKLDIIKRSERGLSGAAIAREVGLARTTVSAILRKSQQIKCISADNSKTARVQGDHFISIERPELSGAVLQELESQITSWYRKETRQGNAVDFEELESKVLSVYTELTKDYSNPGLFEVSADLFEVCKRRFGAASDTRSEAGSSKIINSVALEPICEIVDVDNIDVENSGVNNCQPANSFFETFTEIVERGGYSPLQIFGVYETHLFWKRLPIKEVNDNLLSSKDSIDHVTLLLGCNASGDFKLKPLLVNFMDTPKALLGYPKDKLPVVWKNNRKASVTQVIFTDWFTSHFCPAVEQYCMKNKLDNKALLVLNRSSGYPTSLEDLSDNVKVIFLPSKASSLMQPFNDILMKTYKANYYDQTLRQFLVERQTAIPLDASLEKLSPSYDFLRKSINNIAEAWKKTKSSAVTKAWQQLLHKNVVDFSGIDDDIEEVHESLTEITKELGFGDVNIDYLHEELNFDTDKISDEQLMELTGQYDSESVESDVDVVEIKSLSVSLLGKAIRNFETAMGILTENDPDYGRSTRVCSAIRSATDIYRQLYRDKRKSMELSFTCR